MQLGELLFSSLEGGLSLSCCCLALTSSCISDKFDEFPLLEAAALNLKTSIRHKAEGLTCLLEGELLCNVFNHSRTGWEPVVDIWPFKLPLDWIRDE